MYVVVGIQQLSWIRIFIGGLKFYSDEGILAMIPTQIKWHQQICTASLKCILKHYKDLMS